MKATNAVVDLKGTSLTVVQVLLNRGEDSQSISRDKQANIQRKDKLLNVKNKGSRKEERNEITKQLLFEIIKIQRPLGISAREEDQQSCQASPVSEPDMHESYCTKDYVCLDSQPD